MVCMFISVWFPGRLTFNYHPNIFAYFPSKPSAATTGTYEDAIAILSILVIFPYLLMVSYSIV